MAPDANLLVTLSTPGDSGPATYHHSALQTSFLVPDGDHTAEESGAAYTATTSSWYYVTGVEVLGAPAAGSVVALGDSITDGSGSTSSANRRWPDRSLPAYDSGDHLHFNDAGLQAMADAIDLRDLRPAR